MHSGYRIIKPECVHPLTSLPEAARLLAEVTESTLKNAESIQRLNEFFNGRKQVAGTTATLRKKSDLISGASGETASARVLTIMQEAKRSLSVKEIAAEWTARGWPDPGSGTLYDLIHGTVAYHKRSGTVLRKTRGIYYLPQP